MSCCTRVVIWGENEGLVKWGLGVGILYGEVMLDVLVIYGEEVFIYGFWGNVGYCVVMLMGQGMVSDVIAMVEGWLCEVDLFLGRCDVVWKGW